MIVQAKKYSVPPEYIGKKVNISDTGSGFDITFNDHFIRHWEKSDKMMNFNHFDYLEIARRSSLKHLDEDEIKLILNYSCTSGTASANGCA